MTWTKSDIRAARKADLVDLLTDRSYRLYPMANGNFLVTAKPQGEDGRVLPDPDDSSRPSCPEHRRGVGIIIKHNYWVWPERDMSGNTIDFFLLIEGKSFHQAMQIICAGHDYDASERDLREERGNVPKILR